MELPETVDAVVFDCDGLLVDTESGRSRAEAAPDLCLTACVRLGAAPERCVAVEDSRTGGAGAVRDGGRRTR
jgi:beta-phosphoglucomutase-like phosphatase (HAD superfamily)